ncbi:MAG: hypothetical protein ACU0B9_02450 [Limimaricola soesokkakensis]|jgi:hypothetical protein|nr:hypothetical protein [Limimaricola sp. G21655-S1]MCZ4260839.1 hypothetical protein [Limimaricola sp. G21655-S1]
MSKPPKSDRPLARLAILTVSCALTALFYVALGSFAFGFDMEATGYLLAALVGAFGGVVISVTV